MAQRLPRALPLFVSVFVACLVLGGVAGAQSLDKSFAPNPNGPVRVVLVQPDGKILVAGSFSSTNGVLSSWGIARLNPDGTIDTTFNPLTATDSQVLAIALQADGRIVIGGWFTRIRTRSDVWVTRRALARLNADGTLDAGFNPDPNGMVSALAVQGDGKILVGGDFVTLGRDSGGRRNCLFFGRLNPDGTPDAAFKVLPSRPVSAITLQPDGKILLGGTFDYVIGYAADGRATQGGKGIARLNADGTVDTAFAVSVRDGVYGFHDVRAILVLPDGKVVAGGHFFKADGVGDPGGVARAHIVRFSPGGVIDAGFAPSVSGDWYDTVRTLARQADGKLLVGGTIVKAGGTPPTSDRNHLARFNIDGSIDSAFDPGANRYVNAIAVQADGKVLVGGEFTSIGGGGSGKFRFPYLARFNADGIAQPDTVLDTAYDPGAGPAGAEVLALALQADGKIVVGGAFTTLGGGGTGTTTRHRIGRLNADGSLDTTFNPGANGNVHALLVQPDGKIVVAGGFTTLGGGGTGSTTRNGIGRLNADGSLETAFNPNKTGYLNALVRQSDGKIVGGGAPNWGGYVGPGGSWLGIDWIGRLNANGTIDTTFAPGANDLVFALALQSNGKIVVGGRFSRLGGGGSGVTTRYKIGRLNADGTIDTTFNPGANSEVYAVAVQPDGKILVGGGFTMIGGGGTGTTSRNFIARLNTDGSVDSTFNPGANSSVHSIVVQPNGQILVGGAFNRLGGGGTGTAVREHIGRLNADGSLDTTFDPGADWNVKAFAVQGDGKIVVGGGFNKLGGGGAGVTSRSHIGRLMLASAPTDLSAVPVPTGSSRSATIQTPLGPVSLTFSAVSSAGAASVWNVAADLRALTGAPAGFKFLDLVNFDVTTTAGFSAVNLCVPYSAARVAAARLRESSLRLFHVPGDGTNWVDVTTSLDTSSKQVCGSATHLSTFAIAGLESTIARYLAEGATSSFFDTRLALLNPGTAAATATLTFARKGTTNLVTSVPVPARSRVTVDPKGITGMSQAEFSTKIESDQLLVADRTMSWDGRGYGAHAETAVLSPAPTWYLAEGSTNGFSLFYLLQNPNDAQATVLVKYLRPSGAPIVKTYTLDPRSRTNIWVNEEQFDGLGKALASTDVSAVLDVTNGLDIIVERAMYLDLPGQGFGAGHESAGVTAGATQWFLAEGATGWWFDLFVLIANTESTDAQVEATYLLKDGTVIVKTYTVGANSRFNIWVDYEHALLADAAVSTTIRSTNGVPIIVERAMWWPGSGWYEAHNSAGATTTGTKWAVAEGEVGGDRGVATYLLVANTSDQDAAVRVTVFCEGGPTIEETFTVLAHSRFNVDVGAEFPAARGYRLSALVESTGGSPAQIVVERAMYWDAAGQGWAAGTNALATRLQ